MKKILTILMSAVVFIAFAQEPGTAPEDFKGEVSPRANGLGTIYDVIGKFTLSADGAGSISSSFPISVEKPNASATVHKAILMGASRGFSGYQIPNGCITLAGQPVNWTSTVAGSFSTWNSYGDVTSIVSTAVDPAAPGVINLTVGECNSSQIDGVALLVIFDDPLTFEKSIFILFGAASTTGDNFSISLAEPVDPADPASIFDMGLGISFGFQSPTATDQISIIDVNGQRLTTSAGGQDDGEAANGALITVGGVGDSNNNPPPFAAPTNFDFDDELYNILPFITNTTLNILVSTVNPSNDDNIFLAYFELTGSAILGEGILISQDENTNCINTMHTVVAQVQDDAGAPIVGSMVDFEVISGPNAGAVASVATNASGNATFTYFGSGGAGFDQIQACFVDSQSNTKCSNVLTKEWVVCEEIPVSNWALYLGVLLMITFVLIRFRRMF